MGRSPRPRPKRLSVKLLAIRLSLCLSQTEMRDQLGLDLDHSVISGYELGTREPPLPVLLRYARLVGLSTDVRLVRSLPAFLEMTSDPPVVWTWP